MTASIGWKRFITFRNRHIYPYPQTRQMLYTRKVVKKTIYSLINLANRLQGLSWNDEYRYNILPRCFFLSQWFERKRKNEISSPSRIFHSNLNSSSSIIKGWHDKLLRRKNIYISTIFKKNGWRKIGERYFNFSTEFRKHEARTFLFFEKDFSLPLFLSKGQRKNRACK